MSAQNEAIFSKKIFLLVIYQCKEGFCIYGLSDEIYGTSQDVANACLKDDKNCKAYDYAADEGYGHLCKYPNSEDCSDVDEANADEGSGEECDYEDFRICIKKQGTLKFLHIMHTILEFFITYF